jgi:hypothetical protein
LRCALYFQKCFREINLPVKWSPCEVERNSKSLERLIPISDWVLNLNKNLLSVAILVLCHNCLYKYI